MASPDSETSCAPCSSGKYQHLTISTSYNCHFCKAGFEFRHSESTCDPCSTDTYQAENAKPNPSCQYCLTSALTYIDTKTPCSFCTGGKYQTATGECASCSIGKAADSPVGLGGCKICTQGLYQDEVTSVVYRCKSCKAGKESTTTTVNEACSACAIGKYQNQNDAIESICKFCSVGKKFSAVDSMCSTCESGQYQSENQSPSVVCSTCEKGTAYIDTSSKCTLCVVGTFQSEQGEPNVQCHMCEKGKEFVNVQSACSDCEQGFYQPLDTEINAKCIVCPTGWYGETKQSDGCTQFSTCPVGNGVVFIGSTTSDIVCDECTVSSFSSVDDNEEKCMQHTMCKPGEGKATGGAGTLISDTVCESCDGLLTGDSSFYSGSFSYAPCVSVTQANGRMSWTMTINDDGGITEKQDVAVTQTSNSASGTLTTALQKEYTATISSTTFTAAAPGATVTQGASIGTLKTALTGEETTLVILCDSAVTFRTGTSDLVVDDSGTPITINMTDVREVVRTGAALQNEFTATVESTAFAAAAVGATVTQGASIGTLKTALTGEETTIVILCDSAVTFRTGTSDLVVDDDNGTPVTIDTADIVAVVLSGTFTTVTIQSGIGQIFDTNADLIIGNSTVDKTAIIDALPLALEPVVVLLNSSAVQCKKGFAGSPLYDEEGTYSSGCLPCAVDTFASHDGASACTPFRICSIGSVERKNGNATADRQCYECSKGTIQKVVDGACIICEVGMYQPVSGQTTRKCVNCPVGRFLTNDGTVPSLHDHLSKCK